MSRNLATLGRAFLGRFHRRNDAVSVALAKRCQNRLSNERFVSSSTSSTFTSSSPRQQSSNLPSSQKTIINFAKIKSGPSLEYFLANKRQDELSKDDGNSSTVSTSNLKSASPAATSATESATAPTSATTVPSMIPYLSRTETQPNLSAHFSGVGKKVYFETYGCQMNVNDTEIVWSILRDVGYSQSSTPEDADVVFLMTCAIREGAEQKIWRRLKTFENMKNKQRQLLLQQQKRQRSGSDIQTISRDDIIDGRDDRDTLDDTDATTAAAASSLSRPMQLGVLGCMAERLKTRLVEETKVVDVVCGPDAYRDLPRMLAATPAGHAGVNVLLSLDETYADVMPVRLDSTGISAFVSIMRGCDNMCTYCIVPFTRGRERSRPIHSIEDEVRILRDQGVKEITLLGQNVNSYRDLSGTEDCDKLATKLSNDGFRTVYKSKKGGRRFVELLDRVSLVDPEMRVRFTSPHPKDFPADLLDLINERPNICNYIHLPAQSGCDKVLADMRRGYTKEAYLELVDDIKSRIPDVSLSSDFISGFCGETEEGHSETLDLIRKVKFSFCFAFPYSMREKTGAHRKLTDDVSEAIKKRRHMEVVEAFRAEALILNRSRIGEKHLVLVEGRSKKSEDALVGRNDAFVKVVFPKIPIFGELSGESSIPFAGSYVVVEILEATSMTLIGRPLFHSSVASFRKWKAETETALSFAAAV